MSSAKRDDAKRPKKGRSKKHVPLQGPWRNSSWVNSFGGKGASPLKYKEVSPSFVLRQLLLLMEKGKFIDASQLVNKIQMDSLKDIVMDIPMEVIIESIPQSLILLESLYSRLFVSDADNFPVEQFQVEVMVFHIVRYLSVLESGMGYKHPKPEDAKKSILNILRIVLHVNPDLVRTLYKRKKIMDTALQGIGEHGLIEMKGSLITLHDALKAEIGRNITAYKGAVNTLEHLNLSKSKPLSLKITGDKKSGQGQNHQALTKLNENQVKNRLFKNKALLNAIESHINTQLPALVSLLKDRIEYDKSALLAFGKLKSEIKTFSSHTKVVPLLAQYSRSLRSVLDMFKELLEEHCASDKSSYSTLGYHSDEDMISVQEASNDVESQETVDSETEGVEMKELARLSIEQVLQPPDAESSHDKLSLPGEETPDRRSRWWEHHRRSHSLDIGGSSRNGKNRKPLVSPIASPRSRTSSLDRSSISRPRRESVEESQEFQTMMVRIREMSGSSPAIGRRQLERRGISQPRSRDSSISPAALRRHFFGGGTTGEQTPSISSQTESRDDPEAIYATIIPRSQRSKTTDKEVLKAGPSQAQKLEDVLRERDSLAEKEKKLRRENEQLKETLRLVTMEMEAMKGGASAYEDVLSPATARESQTLATQQILVSTRQTSESKEESPATEPAAPSNDGSCISDQAEATVLEAIPPPQQFSSAESSPSLSPISQEAVVPLFTQVSPESPLSPPASISPSEPDSLSSTSEKASSPKSKTTASFVEKQKAILKEHADRLKQFPIKTHVQLEKLPESSVRQQRASFEQKLKAAHQEASSPPPVQHLQSNPKPDLPGLDKLEAAKPEVAKAEPQGASTELQHGSEQPKFAEQSGGPTETAKPEPTKQETAKQEPAEPNTRSPGQANPETQVPSEKPHGGSAEQSQDTAAHMAAESSQPRDEPSEQPPTEQKSAVDPQESKPPTDLQEQAKPPLQADHRPRSTSPKRAKTATWSAQLHLKTIPESSPSKPKTTSPKEVPDSPSLPILSASNNRLSKNDEVKKQKKTYTHTNRHLPKNLIRHVTGDLLYDYDKLYSEQRAVAWTCITVPSEDKDALLFSCIVFAFRSAQTTIHELHMAKSRMLLIPVTDDEESVSSYTMDIPPDFRSQVELLEHLRKMGDGFDLNPMIVDVMEQLLEITEHVDLLQTSAALKKFVTSCVSLAWRLSIQSAPYVIDFELRSFDPALHQRAQGSNRKSARVKEHIWPALLESSRGMCVYRGVVLT